MNRRDYLNKLKINLQGLPTDEIQDILSDYEEHFDIGISKGKSEEEIAIELGDTREVAGGYHSNYRPSHNVSSPKNNSNDNSKKILLSLLLIVVNIIVLFAPTMAIFGFLIGIFGTGIGLTFGGIGLILRLPFGIFIGNAYPHILTSLGFGVGLGSLGVLVFILAAFLAQLLFKLINKYIKWNIELINR